MGEKFNKLNLIPEFEKHKSRIKFNKDEQKDPSKSGNWDTAGLGCCIYALSSREVSKS